MGLYDEDEPKEKEESSRENNETRVYNEILSKEQKIYNMYMDIKEIRNQFDVIHMKGKMLPFLFIILACIVAFFHTTTSIVLLCIAVFMVLKYFNHKQTPQSI